MIGVASGGSVEYKPLEKSERVRDSQSPTHLGSKLLDERKMVSVQAVTEIERIKRDDMSSVLPRNQVGTGDTKNGVAGRPGLIWEKPALVLSHHDFGIEQ